MERGGLGTQPTHCGSKEQRRSEGGEAQAGQREGTRQKQEGPCRGCCESKDQARQEMKAGNLVR
jgi:hypothetical protein